MNTFEAETRESDVMLEKNAIWYTCSTIANFVTFCGMYGFAMLRRDLSGIREELSTTRNVIRRLNKTSRYSARGERLE